MPRPNSEINAEHLDRIRAWYNESTGELNWASVAYRRILAHYYGLLIPADASAGIRRP